MTDWAQRFRESAEDTRNDPPAGVHPLLVQAMAEAADSMAETLESESLRQATRPPHERNYYVEGMDSGNLCE